MTSYDSSIFIENIFHIFCHVFYLSQFFKDPLYVPYNPVILKINQETQNTQKQKLKQIR